MKVKRHSPEQIVRKLRTAEQLLSQGQAVSDVCRALKVSPATYHRWQQLYGGMKTKSAGGHELVRQNATSRKASPKE
jgi:transposase-like protein